MVRIWGKTSASDIVNPVTGEVIVEEAKRYQGTGEDHSELGINSVDIKYEDTEIRVVGNNFVDVKSVDLPFDILEIDQLEAEQDAYYPG